MEKKGKAWTTAGQNRRESKKPTGGERFSQAESSGPAVKKARESHLLSLLNWGTAKATGTALYLALLLWNWSK